MNICNRQSRRQALTLVEVLALVAAIGLLAVLLLPSLAKTNRRSDRSICVNNLKYVGLAARIWSNDHKERFPWMVSTNEGGTKEFQASPEVFRHFVVMSNELSSPKILCCFYDTERTQAHSFTKGEPVANKNISYFIGLDADEHDPDRLLSGDRHLVGGVTNGPLFSFTASSVPGWSKNPGHYGGNITLADGSVQQFNSESLARQVRSAFATMTNAEMRLAIPRLPGELSKP